MSFKNMKFITTILYWTTCELSSWKYEILLVTADMRSNLLEDTKCASAIKKAFRTHWRLQMKLQNQWWYKTKHVTLGIAVDYVVMRRDNWETSKRDILISLHVCILSLPRSSMASSSSSISSSVTEGAESGMESNESWDNMAARSFLWFCCCCFSPLPLVSIFKLQTKRKYFIVFIASKTVVLNQVVKGPYFKAHHISKSIWRGVTPLPHTLAWIWGLTWWDRDFCLTWAKNYSASKGLWWFLPNAEFPNIMVIVREKSMTYDLHVNGNRVAIETWAMNTSITGTKMMEPKV